MEQNKTNCPFCLPYLCEALSKGFNQHFQLLQDGLIYLPTKKKMYGIDDIIVVVTSCLSCTTSRYLITTLDGLKGMAVEFWETWSE